MELITLTKDNLEKEHICCAISNDSDCQVSSKKKWLSERFDDGLVFRKCDVRGKCFIEYIPAERAWSPVEAPGYMFINCLWVSGKLKGQGYSSLLLEDCIRDSREKGKKGLVILSSEKKLPFLSDPRFLRYKGFLHADTAEPFYVLMYLPFEAGSPKPQFKPHVKRPEIQEPGFVLYHAAQCPFTAKYVPLIEDIAREEGVPFKSVRFETGEQARMSPAPFTSYSLFYDGQFLTNEILSGKKFREILAEKKLR
jgi:GNAT superfamily N-acetyltransferase